MVVIAVRLGAAPIKQSALTALTRLYSSRVSRVGPDMIRPSSEIKGHLPNCSVKIQFSDVNPACQDDPISVWTMFNNTVQRRADVIALSVLRDGKYETWTYKQYQDDVKSVAKAFLKLGLKRYHGVGIMGVNAPEWNISAVAGIISGGLTTGIYATNSVEATAYVARHSRANIMVLEDQEQLEKIQASSESLPELKHIIQYSGKPASPDVISWQQLLEIGRAEPDTHLMERLQDQSVNEPCSLVYTSGTTANPKGVMMSQDNLTWLLRQQGNFYNWPMDKATFVSYLPTSHIAGYLIDIFISMYLGATVHFADKMALQGTLVNTLKDARPTILMGVPRVYEKIHEKLMEVGKKNPGLKKSIADWAKASCYLHHQAEMNGKSGSSLSYKLASKTVIAKVKSELGLDQVQSFHSGAAPTSPEIFNYFLSLDIPIQEAYGSTESSAFVGCRHNRYTSSTKSKAGTVGIPIPGMECKIDNPDSTGLGEICSRGRQNCIGYLWEKEKTEELVDAEGWLHLGDLGRLDNQGFLTINGRMKEIIITGAGKNIAPVPIEEKIKAEMVDIISAVMVVGDKRKHLSCILTLRTELDAANQPTDVLHPNVIQWARSLGSKATTVSQLLKEKSEAIDASIMKSIQKVNNKADHNALKVHKFMVAPRDFTLAGGELTPTLKMKRFVIQEMYAKEIDKLYEGNKY